MIDLIARGFRVQVFAHVVPVLPVCCQVHFMGPGECKVELSTKEDAPLKRLDDSYAPRLQRFVS